MRKFRFHVVALPHTQTNKEFCACAYTMKVFNFCKMMASLGHDVFHYGPEGSNPDCTENIQIISTREQQLLYGTYPKETIFPVKWDRSLPLWQLTNSRVLVEILQRKEARDFVCIIGGSCQKPIADAVGLNVQVVEFGIGYSGVFAKYKVFESYTHMAAVIGPIGLNQSISNYDVVIPNYYDLEDFPFGAEKEDYYLYIGRISNCKGVNIAVQATAEIGAKLVLAGQGVTRVGRGLIVTPEFTITDPRVSYAGCLGVADRARIVGKARAVLAPSRYLEPFGGVAVEAQLMGTPVITSDWGAFAETVEHAKTGYRCRTLSHFVDACVAAGSLDNRYIRERAIDLYSTERVKWMYQEYFTMLQDLWNPKGWGLITGESDLNWLAPASVRNAAAPSSGDMDRTAPLTPFKITSVDPVIA